MGWSGVGGAESGSQEKEDMCVPMAESHCTAGVNTVKQLSSNYK